MTENQIEVKRANKRVTIGKKRKKKGGGGGGGEVRMYNIIACMR